MNTTNAHASRLRLIATSVDLHKYAVIVRQAADEIDRLHGIVYWPDATPGGLSKDQFAQVLCEQSAAVLDRLWQMGAWDHINCLEDNLATLQLQHQLDEQQQ